MNHLRLFQHRSNRNHFLAGSAALFFCAASIVCSNASRATDFSFSKAEAESKAQDAKQQADRQANIEALLKTPCGSKIKNQKIMVLIGETRNGYVYAAQTAFNPHFEAVNSRLQALGLKTYTQAQIRSQIAQAEIDAYFKNDIDAAMSASKRLAAQYILKGLISAQANYNYAARVNQVNVSMNFTLTGSNGRTLSQTSTADASYAGQDVAGMALTLINERAEEVVATLYSDFCRNVNKR
jgi:hypothetical protein